MNCHSIINAPIASKKIICCIEMSFANNAGFKAPWHRWQSLANRDSEMRGGGGQRLFGLFLEIHPFWRRQVVPYGDIYDKNKKDDGGWVSYYIILWLWWSLWLHYDYDYDLSYYDYGYDGWSGGFLGTPATLQLWGGVCDTRSPMGSGRKNKWPSFVKSASRLSRFSQVSFYSEEHTLTGLYCGRQYHMVMHQVNNKITNNQ